MADENMRLLEAKLLAFYERNKHKDDYCDGIGPEIMADFKETFGITEDRIGKIEDSHIAPVKRNKDGSSQELDFTAPADWGKMVTIDDLWNHLFYRGDISLEERLRVELLEHSEQQRELEKYKETH
jgi:hypothetical protein